MQKPGFSLLGILMILVIGSATIVSGQSDDEMCVPMGTIVLEPPESVEAKRSAVEFPHSTHFILDCKNCHHEWKGDEVIQTCSTSGCHDVTESPIKTGKGAVDPNQAILYYKTAYHNMCIGCHKEMRRINKELELSYKKLDKELPRTGPTGCIQCHPKE
ncbi:MAG: cytochrome c3 family protein [Desulfobacterales bacterium]|nr:MAG: cytochrome c3 family protein [Desulfobacterales bacterium]